MSKLVFVLKTLSVIVAMISLMSFAATFCLWFAWDEGYFPWMCLSLVIAAVAGLGFQFLSEEDLVPRLNGSIQRFKPSSFPRLPHPTLHSSAEKLANMKFVQQQYCYYTRITWRLGGLWVFSFLVGFLGLSSMLNGNIHSVVAIAVICLCLALIIPVGIGLYIIGSIAEQHGTWLEEHPGVSQKGSEA